MLFIGNAFLFNMITPEHAYIEYRRLISEQVRILAPQAEFCIRRRNLAEIISKELNVVIKPTSKRISLGVGDAFILGQFKGTKIPNETTTLPAGAYIEWFLIAINS